MAVKMYLLGMILLLGPAALEAANQEYPVKPVRVIVPYAPGGATDTVTRIVAPKLAEILGQPFVIDNRTGASGNIALELTARAAPDGYTLLMGTVSTNSINPTLFAHVLKVDPARDLTGIALIAAIPNVLVSGSGFPPNTLKEVCSSKQKPTAGRKSSKTTTSSLNKHRSRDIRIINSAIIRTVFACASPA